MKQPVVARWRSWSGDGMEHLVLREEANDILAEAVILGGAGSSAFAVSTCWYRGTGRCSLRITSVSPRTACIQSPNSSAFETVAESDTSRTSEGRCRMISSQTAPRQRSPR